MTRTRSVSSAIAVVVLLAVLAGCGPMPEPTPTTSPQITPPVEESDRPRRERPQSAELTLGELAERINAAWPTVRSYRITFTGSTLAAPAGVGTPVARPLATPVATPMATPGATPVARQREAFVSIREVVLPDRQRQEVRGLGENDHEAIATGDRLYVRGPLVEQIAPGTPDDVWIVVDPTTLPEGSVLSRMLGGLPEIPAAPLASLPERLFPQVIREMGVVDTRWPGVQDLWRGRHRPRDRDAGRLHDRRRRAVIIPASSKPAPVARRSVATNTATSTLRSPSSRRWRQRR